MGGVGGEDGGVCSHSSLTDAEALLLFWRQTIMLWGRVGDGEEPNSHMSVGTVRVNLFDQNHVMKFLPKITASKVREIERWYDILQGIVYFFRPSLRKESVFID